MFKRGAGNMLLNSKARREFHINFTDENSGDQRITEI